MVVQQFCCARERHTSGWGMASRQSTSITTRAGTSQRHAREEPWFVSLAILGALYVGAVAYRLLHTSGIALCLCRPKDLRRRYGAWAVVTGPTSGIGRSMALELARRGLNLVLVGRDPAKLQDIAGTVSETHGVLTKTVQFDFSRVSTPQGEAPRMPT